MLIKHCNTVRYELQEDTKLREIIVLRGQFKSLKSKIAQIRVILWVISIVIQGIVKIKKNLRISQLLD